MAIVTTISGTADNDSIRGLQIVRTPDTGALQVEVYYQVGTISKHLTLDPSVGFKSSIEATFAEIKAAIDAAEGLS